MNLAQTLLSAGLLAVVAGSTSCSVAPLPNPDQKKILKAQWVNPNPPGSYAYFTAEPSYPKTYNVFRDPSLLERTSKANSRILIDLSLQRAIIFTNDEVAMDYPIASGKSTFPTPPGKYQILEKIKSEKRSNLYGTIYDAEGKIHKSDADATKDEIPEGGNFKGASMPYWMRLSWGGIGMHQGRVPRYPASHGCVRMPSKISSTVFSKIGVGTPVSIER
jgi:lipoprotein-anchoring transpeptidase ErfK/SrfK